MSKSGLDDFNAFTVPFSFRFTSEKLQYSKFGNKNENGRAIISILFKNPGKAFA